MKLSINACVISFSDLECYTRNVDSYGNDIKILNGISSASACQILCLNNAGCNYFVYGPQTMCHLKSNEQIESKNKRIIAHAGLIFGPKRCGIYTYIL